MAAKLSSTEDIPEVRPTTSGPASVLGYHRLLGPSCGVRVSPLCLGAMNFGDAWSSFMGECSKETTFEILDFFYAQGGNFIDTASNYQNEQSEAWIGEWMEKRGVRDQMVVATKVSSLEERGDFETYDEIAVFHWVQNGNGPQSYSEQLHWQQHQVHDGQR